jgi:hypothetical protein
VAIPFEIWDWAAEIAAPPGAMDEWRRTDIGDFVGDLTGLPVHAANDGTAACAAEQVFGTSGRSDFVYFFIGTFVGGGIVTDGNLLGGRRGNAGALGSMPVPLEGGGTGQLINAASIHLLEKAMAENGLDPRTLWAEEGVWPAELGPLLDRWIETSAWPCPCGDGGERRLRFRMRPDRRQPARFRTQPLGVRDRPPPRQPPPSGPHPGGDPVRHDRRPGARDGRGQPAVLRPLPAGSTAYDLSEPAYLIGILAVFGQCGDERQVSTHCRRFGLVWHLL